MQLEKIISISGKPGLYKLISQLKNGFIIEDVVSKKKVSIGNTSQVSLLDNIAMFTFDKEVPLFEEAVRLCDNAKKRQTTAINKSIKIIEEDMPRDIRNSVVYVDEDQDLSFELSGLIANKILSSTNKPVILLREFLIS